MSPPFAWGLYGYVKSKMDVLELTNVREPASASPENEADVTFIEVRRYVVEVGHLIRSRIAGW